MSPTSPRIPDTAAPRRGRWRRASLAPLAVAAALVAPGCERAGSRYDNADAPEPAPKVVGAIAALPEGSGRRSTTMTAEAAAECGRGTGRNLDGECVGLGLLEFEHVQRVQIPAGEFVMGHIPQIYDARPTRDAPAVRWSGQPPRYARVDSFWIDLHEVSREAYQACVDAGACTPAACPAGIDDPVAALSPEIAQVHPQTCVTHDQAAAYCAHVQGRLPTEAEWEFASRGPDARFYPWGNDILDEISRGLYPVGRMRQDMSYFGILGMGSNAIEWVADVYEPDVGLRPFLAGGGEFRDPQGPASRAREAWERQLACGDAPEPGCVADEAARRRHVVKLSLAGARRAARAQLPAHVPEAELEGWVEIAQHPNLGFRCAADLLDGRDTPLRVPAATATIPFTRDAGSGLDVFGGIAEAVSKAEAERFCELLAVPGPGDAPLTGWRLPTTAEVLAIADSFRGPGPFWTADGAVIQAGDTPVILPDAPWTTLEVDDPSAAALAARCVRG
ncbi:MAG: SUMF1/EgtB/PvdO family nonheme iron enzyme [Nannocystaceae bacterium]